MMRAYLLSLALFSSLIALMPPHTDVFMDVVAALTAAVCLFGGLTASPLTAKQKAPE